MTNSPNSNLESIRHFIVFEIFMHLKDAPAIGFPTVGPPQEQTRLSATNLPVGGSATPSSRPRGARFCGVASAADRFGLEWSDETEASPVQPQLNFTGIHHLHPGPCPRNCRRSCPSLKLCYRRHWLPGSWIPGSGCSARLITRRSPPWSPWPGL